MKSAIEERKHLEVHRAPGGLLEPSMARHHLLMTDYVTVT